MWLYTILSKKVAYLKVSRLYFKWYPRPTLWWITPSCLCWHISNTNVSNPKTVIGQFLTIETAEITTYLPWLRLGDPYVSRFDGRQLISSVNYTTTNNNAQFRGEIGKTYRKNYVNISNIVFIIVHGLNEVQKVFTYINWIPHEYSI